MLITMTWDVGQAGTPMSSDDAGDILNVKDHMLYDHFPHFEYFDWLMKEIDARTEEECLEKENLKVVEAVFTYNSTRMA